MWWDWLLHIDANHESIAREMRTIFLTVVAVAILLLTGLGYLIYRTVKK